MAGRCMRVLFSMQYYQHKLLPASLPQDTLITPASMPDGAEAPSPAIEGQAEQQV